MSAVTPPITVGAGSGAANLRGGTDDAQGRDPVHVRVREVHRSYGQSHILKGVSFDVQRGAVNVLIGASGSGKTVMMRQLIRLEKPDGGRIELDGLDIVPLNERQLFEVRRKLGMVFQMSALFDSMDVYDNVAFPLREHTRMKERALRERVMDRLGALGVEHAARRQVSELSGGMRKRVAVARALVLEPELLIYDEPTTGLDPITSRTVDDLITETGERFGVTSLVISHDMVSVARIASHVHYLYQGRIEASGSVAELGESDNERVREFFAAASPPAAAG